MAKKLLLLEDNLSIQHLVQTIFASEDFEVIVTNDATDGLRTIESWLPDIVLADASMPGIDGFQLCQIIRNTASIQHIPVLLLTSLFAAYDTAKGARVGVNAHLPKPFESPALLAIVQQLMAPGAKDLAGGTTIPSLSSETLTMLSRDGEHVPAEELTMNVVPTSAPGKDRLQSLRAPAELVVDSVTSAAVPQSSLAASERATAAGAPPMSPATSLPTMHTFLGQEILQLLQHTLDVQIASMLEKITPQIVAAVRDAVMAQTPPLLATLLQQEIDKLKQEVDHDDSCSSIP